MAKQSRDKSMEEIKVIIAQAYAKAKEILLAYRDGLDAIANRLIVAESIDGPELALLAGTSKVVPMPELAPAI